MSEVARGEILIITIYTKYQKWTHFQYASLPKFTQFLSFASKSLIYYWKHHRTEKKYLKMKSFSYIIVTLKQNLYRMKIFLGLKSNFLREIKCNILELNKYSLMFTSKKHEHIETFMSPHL